MLRRYIPIALLMIPAFVPSVAQTPAHSRIPPDAEIRKMLANRIDIGKQSIGIVVGVIGPDVRRIVSYGSPAKDDTRPLNGDTVFEIGSMTKVFTSLVLMDMVQRGEVALDDPVSKYLPPEVKVPERGGKKITLRDLSTQSSGLPRMPTNFHPKDAANPYADYTVQQLYEFLSGYELTRDIGQQYEYSNLGVALLGQALSRRAGMDYESMVRARILKPLGMTDTRVTLSSSMKERLAVGHDTNLKPVPNWDLPVFAGAGALRSTANDILTFLAANLGFTKTALAPAMAAEVSVRRPAGAPDIAIAYGWHMFTGNGKTLYWHNGGTGGYSSCMGYDPKDHVGVVALANAYPSIPSAVDGICHHLLDPDFPFTMVEPKKEHTAITLDSKTLDVFVGQYQLTPNFVLTISRDGDSLFAQATGQGQFEIFPEDPRTFFAKITELTISFQSEANGKSPALTLHQNGQNTPAKRIEREHTAITLDSKTFDAFVGRYQVSPNSVLTISRDGDRLFAQATGQDRFEIFPEGPRTFFAHVPELTISFEKDVNGKAPALTLHQYFPAKRID